MSQVSTYLRRIPFYLGIALILLYILFPVYWMFISSDEIGLLALDRRPLYFQPFEMTQLARDGLWDQTPLLDAIDRQQFAAILIFTIPDPPLHRDRWSDEMLSRIDRRYDVAEVVGNTVVYRPKTR